MDRKFPELETTRFLLQKTYYEDQAFVYKALSDPQVIPFYGVRYDSFEATKAQIDWFHQIWEEGSGIWWKIVSKETGQPVGACGTNYYHPQHERAEIGYWLLPEFWKKGIMQEVLPVAINHLFTTWKLHRLEAIIEKGNESSARLSEKLGFKFEGELRDAEVKNGKRISLLMYSLLATDRDAKSAK